MPSDPKMAWDLLDWRRNFRQTSKETGGEKMVKIAIAVSALCLVWTAVALADSAIAIRNDGTCSMAGADADGNVTFGGNGQVATELENGNKVMLKCKGTDI